MDQDRPDAPVGSSLSRGSLNDDGESGCSARDVPGNNVPLALLTRICRKAVAEPRLELPMGSRCCADEVLLSGGGATPHVVAPVELGGMRCASSRNWAEIAAKVASFRWSSWTQQQHCALPRLGLASNCSAPVFAVNLLGLNSLVGT